MFPSLDFRIQMHKCTSNFICGIFRHSNTITVCIFYSIGCNKSLQLIILFSSLLSITMQKYIVHYVLQLAMTQNSIMVDKSTGAKVFRIFLRTCGFVYHKNACLWLQSVGRTNLNFHYWMFRSFLRWKKVRKEGGNIKKEINIQYFYRLFFVLYAQKAPHTQMTQWCQNHILKFHAPDKTKAGVTCRHGQK